MSGKGREREESGYGVRVSERRDGGGETHKNKKKGIKKYRDKVGRQKEEQWEIERER